MLRCDKTMLQCNDKLTRGRPPHDFLEESIGFFDRVRMMRKCARGVMRV